MQALLALAAAAFVYGALTAMGMAQTKSFDPESCSTETGGLVFVRLHSGLAFGFPARDLVMLAGSPAQNPFPQVAEAGEPEGCPTHPFMDQFFWVVYRPVAPRHPAEPEDSRWEPRSLVIHSWNGAATLQDMDIESFRTLCVTKTHPASWRFGFVDFESMQECRDKTLKPPDWDDRPLFFLARPSAHPEFAGRRFAGLCRGEGGAAGAPRICKARYQLETGPTVMYEFSDAVVPHEHFTDFDLQIRAFVEAIRAPELDVQADGN